MKWWQFTIFVVLNIVIHDYTIPAEFVPIAAGCIYMCTKMMFNQFNLVHGTKNQKK